MKVYNIIVIGAVGTARNVCEQIIDARERYDYPVRKVFIVIDSFKKGELISGTKVIGSTSDISELLKDKNNKFIFCLHKPEKLKERYELAGNLNIPVESYISFIHPQAYIAPSVRMGYSNVIMSNTTIQSDIRLGNFNIINSNVTIEHETSLGDGNFIAANCCIGANVKTGNYNFLGLNSTVRENVNFGNNVFVGMNSLVLNDFSDIKIFGQPARPSE